MVCHNSLSLYTHTHTHTHTDIYKSQYSINSNSIPIRKSSKHFIYKEVGQKIKESKVVSKNCLELFLIGMLLELYSINFNSIPIRKSSRNFTYNFTFLALSTNSFDSRNNLFYQSSWFYFLAFLFHHNFSINPSIFSCETYSSPSCTCEILSHIYLAKCGS